LTFAFLSMSQQRFNDLAMKLDAIVSGELGPHEYEVYSNPSGPADWAATKVEIRLEGIQKARDEE